MLYMRRHWKDLKFRYLQQFHDYQMWGMFHVFIFEAPSKMLQEISRGLDCKYRSGALASQGGIGADKITDIHSQLLVHTKLSPGNVMLVHGGHSPVLHSCQVRITEIEAAVAIGSYAKAGRKLSPFQAPETLLGCIVFQLETGKPFLWTNGAVDELLFLMGWCPPTVV
ncbi:hypothetical protein BKA70DRAFT_1239704 [Coprinopsis sp. MPI-PUGE-AT-0042]|nr:hypothetical protein BKA70DRAFT_1239704 [Coprinopsis sp. MPI-PUGE-AT-0042]